MENAGTLRKEGGVATRPRIVPETKPIQILMIEDNPGDVRLTQEALKRGRIWSSVAVARDGVEAMEFLHQTGKFAAAPRPDLILLDLNLPRKDGRQVLAEIKADEKLRVIPVVVLTTSRSEEDVLKAYGLYANCYITKPIDFHRFAWIIQGIQDFWFTIVKLPRKHE